MWVWLLVVVVVLAEAATTTEVDAALLIVGVIRGCCCCSCRWSSSACCAALGGEAKAEGRPSISLLSSLAEAAVAAAKLCCFRSPSFSADAWARRDASAAFSARSRSCCLWWPEEEEDEGR